MASRSKNESVPVSRMVEDIVGCKWSLAVIGAIRSGISRPGAIVRTEEGLTQKVLNERLKKLQRYGILEKEIFPETPPRVEYRLTGFGRRFLRILDEIDALQKDVEP